MVDFVELGIRFEMLDVGPYEFNPYIVNCPKILYAAGPQIVDDNNSTDIIAAAEPVRQMRTDETAPSGQKNFNHCYSTMAGPPMIDRRLRDIRQFHWVIYPNDLDTTREIGEPPLTVTAGRQNMADPAGLAIAALANCDQAPMPALRVPTSLGGDWKEPIHSTFPCRYPNGGFEEPSMNRGTAELGGIAGRQFRGRNQSGRFETRKFDSGRLVAVEPGRVGYAV